MGNRPVMIGSAIALPIATGVNVSLVKAASHFDIAVAERQLVPVFTGIGILLATFLYRLLNRFVPTRALNIWGALLAVFLTVSLVIHPAIVGLLHVTPVALLFFVVRASRSMVD